MEVNNTPALLLGSGILAGLAGVTAYLFSRKDKRQRKRRLSFTSVGLGIGSFPPEANVREPIINAAVYFDELPSRSSVEAQIVGPLLAYERLSHVPDLERRVCRRSSRGDVAADQLVREVQISGDEALLNQTIVEHCPDPLSCGREDLPWWEILIIRNTAGGQPSACVVRIHHVIGDGLALVSAFNKLLTTVDNKPLASSRSSFNSSAARKSSTRKRGLLSNVFSLIEATVHCLTLSATNYDDDTVFSRMNHSRMKHCGKRQAVIFPTVPLQFIKDLKQSAGVTVNDILMAAVSHAIYAYCRLQKDSVLEAKKSGIQCRALLPVGFPRDQNELNDKSTAMKNLWCMVSCGMGVGESNIRDRIEFIRSKTREMKEKPRAYMQLAIQNSLGPFIPLFIGQQTVFDTFSRHSLVLTNVPGPPEECRFAGARVKSVQLFFDNLLTQVDLISYSGNVYGNIIYDANELPGADVFGKLYIEGLVELAREFEVELPPELME